MTTVHTKIFKSNQSQAVRLPKAVALPDNVREVDIVAIGNMRIITPAGKSWDDWFDGVGVTDDFMPSREQPVDQMRESL
jgi:antitoxin VapB